MLQATFLNALGVQLSFGPLLRVTISAEATVHGVTAQGEDITLSKAKDGKFLVANQGFTDLAIEQIGEGITAATPSPANKAKASQGTVKAKPARTGGKTDEEKRKAAAEAKARYREKKRKEAAAAKAGQAPATSDASTAPAPVEAAAPAAAPAAPAKAPKAAKPPEPPKTKTVTASPTGTETLAVPPVTVEDDEEDGVPATA